MKAIICIVLALVSFYLNGQATTYYVSPSGKDGNSGLTITDAWKSIEKVNQVNYRSGDSILFESGGTWQGNLQPMGSGKHGQPITISSYGEGSMPVISTGEAAGAGIRLVNQSWWVIQGIEITSGAQPQLGVKREGISVTAEEGEKTEGIVIRDCYIHDIWGQIGGAATSRMIDVGPEVIRDHDAVNNILIENNTIKRCDKVGIVVNGRDDIVVRGNYMENLGGDGIIVGGAYQGLIEYNIAHETCLRTGDLHLDTGDESRFSWWPHTAAIWLIWTEETVMQFNEVYNTGRQYGNGDGQAYDFDFGCRNNILQYNYSRNNAGFLLIMDNTFGNIVRYNVSENDVKFRPTQLITMFCDTTEHNLIHNNVFYVDRGTSDITYYYGDEYGPDAGKGKRDKGKLGAHFRNNIFYATSQGRFRTVYALGDSLNSAEFRRLEDFHELPPPENGTRFYNNLYFGPWYNGLPDDPRKIVADPLFVEPGSGKYGLSTLYGYRLRSGSPASGAGVVIGTDANHDFYGNPLKDRTTNIGIFETKGPENNGGN